MKIKKWVKNWLLKKDIIEIFHELDGYEEYNRKQFLKDKVKLQEIVDRYPYLIQRNNELVVVDGNVYKIVGITIGLKLIQLYVINI